MSNYATFKDLPYEILLDIAEYLKPREIISFMKAVPNLAYGIPRRLVTKPDNGDTLLNYLAEDRDTAEICRRLIPRMEINVNVIADWGPCALYTAISKHHNVMVDLLLARPDIQVNDPEEDWIPLYAAISHENIPSLRKLLARNDVDVNAGIDEGQTPLMYAATFGHTEAVELLLKAPGVLIEPERGTLLTPLTIAARAGYPDIVRFLLPLAYETDAMGTPLVDVNVRSTGGRTPLILASLNGKHKTVQALLEHDIVDVNARDCNRRSALSYAAQKGHRTVMRMLLARRDIEVNEPNSRRRTPLAYSAALGSYAACRMLLDHPNVNPHAKDSTGRTPLIHAVQSKKVSVFRLLLNQCTNGEENWKDRTGRSAWDYAKQLRCRRMMQIFRDYQRAQGTGPYNDSDVMDVGEDNAVMHEGGDNDAMDVGED